MLLYHLTLQLFKYLRVSAPSSNLLLITPHRKHGKTLLLTKGSEYYKTTTCRKTLIICTLARHQQNRYSLPFKRIGGTATEYATAGCIGTENPPHLTAGPLPFREPMFSLADTAGRRVQSSVLDWV